jgi:hypothetical protein
MSNIYIRIPKYCLNVSRVGRRVAGFAVFSVLSIFSMLSSAALENAILSDYSSLQKALENGREVKAKVDFSQCAVKDSSHGGPNLHGGMRIDSYIVLPDRNIAFSDVHRTLDTLNRPLTEYVRYRVSPDQTATISVTVLDGTSGAATKSDTFKCSINRGIQFIGQLQP